LTVEKNRARVNTIDPRNRIMAQRKARTVTNPGETCGRERSSAQLGRHGELGCQPFIANAPRSAGDAEDSAGADRAT